jgi:hypothetical protein
LCTPKTAGIPYSRATTEPWVIIPPTSITSASAERNNGVEHILTATSYEWQCPHCRKRNFLPYRKEKVTCPHCRSEFPIVGILHAGEEKPTNGGGAVLVANNYQMACGECDADITVQKPAEKTRIPS